MPAVLWSFGSRQKMYMCSMCKEPSEIDQRWRAKMRWHPLVLIALLLAPNAILVYATAAPDNSSGQSGSADKDDSGFRPDINGFSFQNYGDDPSIVDLTSVEMQRMFGDKVCASKADGKCVLTYPAKR